MIANRTQLADIFGVAKTTVDAWVSKGCPVVEKGGKGTPSKYDTADVYRWLTLGRVYLDFTEERAKLAVEQAKEARKRYTGRSCCSGRNIGRSIIHSVQSDFLNPCRDCILPKPYRAIRMENKLHQLK